VAKEKKRAPVNPPPPNTEEAQYIFSAFIASLQGECSCSTCQIIRPIARRMLARYTEQTLAELKGKEEK